MQELLFLAYKITTKLGRSHNSDCDEEILATVMGSVEVEPFQVSSVSSLSQRQDLRDTDYFRSPTILRQLHQRSVPGIGARWGYAHSSFIISTCSRNCSGITKAEANLKDQLFFVEGIAPPSAIVSAIESTGRDAILRGSGRSNSAGVCILETHSSTVPVKVKGLARIVQVASDHTLVDLTIRGLQPGLYHATVRDRGDISEGAASTGAIWEGLKVCAEEAHKPKGDFGIIEIGSEGKGNTFLSQNVAIWELIGRSIVVSRSKQGPFQREDPQTLVGVIARSAGVWDNDKTVCSCSGKNVWQERKDQKDQGML